MEKIRQDILDSVEKIPAFPHSVHQVQKLSADINCNPSELVKVIEHDPVLVLRILKMVNSSYFGLAKKITSVNHAIIYIGLNTIKNLAMSIATIGVMPRQNESGFDTDVFLLHSLSTATVSRMLARKAGVVDKESFDYFLSGLLHDFGKILLARYLPKDYKVALKIAAEDCIPLHEVEKQMFGVSHAAIGSLLAEKWQMPENLNRALQNHHDYNSEKSQLGDFLTAADQISKELHIGFSGDNIVEELPQQVLTKFGVDIDHVIVSLGDIRAEVEKAAVLLKY
jgi:putative nucleotidyltransferase with HDIG domain